MFLFGMGHRFQLKCLAYLFRYLTNWRTNFPYELKKRHQTTEVMFALTKIILENRCSNASQQKYFF